MIAVRDAGKYNNQELKGLVQNIGGDCGIRTNQIQVNNLYIDSNNVPCGCLLGYVLTFLIDRQAFQPFTDLIIVLLAGTASFLVVKISVRKPAKIAMAVSPIAAFNYSSYAGGKEKNQKHHKLNPGSLAFMNLSRNKRKSTMTFISLALSGMLLVSLSSLLTSLDPMERAKQSFPYEGVYMVELNRKLISPTVSITDLQANNPLTDELYRNLQTIDGVNGIVCKKELRAMVDGTETTIWGMNTEDNEKLSKMLMEGILPGADRVGKDTLVINNSSPELEYLGKTYELGDTVSFSLTGNDGLRNISFVVSAIISDCNNAFSFILPESEIMQVVQYNTNSTFIVQSETGYSQDTENVILSLTSSNDTLRVETLNDLIMQYESVFSTISVAVYALLAFITVFSIINLVNTSMTTIISRRKEIGLLRAVGLDNKQLCRMVSVKNMFQTIGSFVFSTAFGLIIGQGICLVVQSIPGFNFVKYTFPLFALPAYLPVIILLHITLTKWASQYYRKKQCN